jgi:hypothetical protein
MKSMLYTEICTVYSSDVCPDVVTRNERDAELIRWADAFCPVVWKIITTNKSKAFGTHSCFYLGGIQGGLSSNSILQRLKAFHRELNRRSEDVHFPTDFFAWKANFTLEHFNDKGFTGGLFQQWDGKYNRGCSILDYTPSTLPDVIERFVTWCGGTFETRAVKIDEKVVWTPEGDIHGRD